MKINSLKAEFVRNGQTQKEVAQKLGITPRTLSNKLKSGVFTNKEIERLKDILNIDDISIFFDIP